MEYFQSLKAANKLDDSLDDIMHYYYAVRYAREARDENLEKDFMKRLRDWQMPEEEPG